MDEVISGELSFHQQVATSDANTPLHLIREKELEISGHVLAAKRTADEIVTNARQASAVMIAEAKDKVRGVCDERTDEIRLETEKEIAKTREQAARDMDVLRKTLSERSDVAVAAVLDAVTGA